MSTFINTHGACFHAELQKMRHTALPWLCMGAALFLPLIQTIASFVLSTGQQDNAWQRFLQDSLTGFSSFFYPLFLIILIGRIVYMEHKADTWKVLETQPVSRAALFLVKFEVAALIAAACLLMVIGFSALGGFLLQTFKPVLGFSRSHVDWGLIAQGSLRLWIASLGLLALQYYLSLLIKNFAAPLTIGLIGIIASGIMINFGIWGWFPYNAVAMTTAAFKGSPTGAFLLYHEYLSLCWAALFLGLAYQLLRQRGFVAAHLRGVRGIATALGLLVFGALVWQLSKPQLMGRYSATVIAGSIKTIRGTKQVALVRSALGDTVGLAPVKDGKFHLALAVPLETGFYELQGNGARVELFFGSKDSLYVDLLATKDDYKLVFSGTRAAESEFLQNRGSRPDFRMAQRFAAQNPPALFASDILEELDSKMAKAKRFTTMDNIGLAPDFITLFRKQAAIDALRELEIEYPKTFALYNPGGKLKYPARVDSLRNEIAFDNAALLTIPSFTEYTSDYIRAQAATSSNRDSAFTAVSARLLTNIDVKEAVIARLSRERMRMIHDTAARVALLNAALAQISSPVHRRRLQGELAQLNAMMRGRPAPNFASATSNGTAFTLDRFRGRYVVLDIWATWCGPCKRESPIFEELAERLTDESLVFAAVSVDEDKKAWLREAGFKSPRVLQLHVADPETAFMKPYGIETIPRFILIDRQGRIVNANMPPPSEPEFESILQREVYSH